MIAQTSALRRRVRADLVREYGNVYWDTWPWRAKVRSALVAPSRAARLVSEWLSEVAVWPGDVFEDPRRFVTITVRAVRPTSVTVDVVAHGARWQARSVVVDRTAWRPWVRDVARAEPPMRYA